MLVPIVVLLLVVVGLALLLTFDLRRRRRVDREWGVQPAAALAQRVDVERLTAVRRTEGELVAIKALRDYLPGCPLRRSRELVAELTGMAPGTR